MRTTSAHPSYRLRMSHAKTGTSTSRSTLNALGSVHTRSTTAACGPPATVPLSSGEVTTASVRRSGADSDDDPRRGRDVVRPMRQGGVVADVARLAEGTLVVLVGPSGSGKSTWA